MTSIAALARINKAFKSVKRADLLEKVQKALQSWGGSLEFIAQPFQGGEWRHWYASHDGRGGLQPHLMHRRRAPAAMQPGWTT